MAEKVTLGDRIEAAVGRLGETGRFSVRESRSGESPVYELAGGRCAVRIAVDPGQGLSLSFTLHDERAQKPLLTYYIDTDLYDVSDSRFREFAEDIEGDIVAFLDALDSGQILIGTVGRKVALIAPDGDGFVRIQKGAFVSSSKRYDNLVAAQSRGSFAPLAC